MKIQDWLGEDNQLGIDGWTKKYQKNEESFDAWLDRVSGGDERFKQLIIEKKCLPGGRILSNRGLCDSFKSSYSNCYVIVPPEDNIESIFDCAKKLARTYSYGGGCGVDISALAPNGARVRNAAKETTGAVSFMDLYSLVTGLIAQKGRRGALMLSIACDHPDLEEFIHVKSDLNRVTKANISIRITDKFMQAVKNKEMFRLSFTRKETGETIEKWVNAYDIFHQICEMNWNYAEPGMLFWDTINKDNLLEYDSEFSYAGVNPCAEEPLPAGGSCLLASMNLSAFVKEDGKFDFDGFRQSVDIAVRALNDILDEGIPLHPLEEQRRSVSQWRQIGLGIMGLADMLIKMGITYGSTLSLGICDSIGRTMVDQALKTSALLAKEYEPYPQYNQEAILRSNFLMSHALKDTYDLIKKYGLRNSQLLTIAPTGTISTMLGISGGIEPIFANSYTRKTESLHGHDEYYKVYTPIVKQYMEDHHIENEDELPSYFVTAQTLDYRQRIDMQSIWQQHIDASISSTVNVPNDFTVEQVEYLYMRAWEQRCKGITIFRAGCARTGILTTDETKDNCDDPETTCSIDTLPRGYILKTTDDMPSFSKNVINGCGDFTIHLDFDDDSGKPYQTWISVGDGGCERNLDFISRLISLCLRAGVPLSEIIRQARKVRPCAAYIRRQLKFGDTSKGSSCPSATGNALEDLQKKISSMAGYDYDSAKEETVQIDTKKQEVNIIQGQSSHELCPECGSELKHDGGCVVCTQCAWSKCD